MDWKSLGVVAKEDDAQNNTAAATTDKPTWLKNARQRFENESNAQNTLTAEQVQEIAAKPDRGTGLGKNAGKSWEVPSSAILPTDLEQKKEKPLFNTQLGANTQQGKDLLGYGTRHLPNFGYHPMEELSKLEKDNEDLIALKKRVDEPEFLQKNVPSPYGAGGITQRYKNPNVATEEEKKKWSESADRWSEYQAMRNNLSADADRYISSEMRYAAKDMSEKIAPFKERLNEDIKSFEIRTGNRVYSDVGMLAPGATIQKPMGKEAVKELRQLMGRRNALKIADKYIATLNGISDVSKLNSGFKSFVQGVGQQDLTDFATFGMNSIADSYNIVSYMKKASEGKPLSQEEEAALQLYKSFEELSSEKDIPWQYQGGQALIQSIPFMVEIGFTGGVRTGVQKAIKVFAEKAARGLANRGAKEAVQKGVSVAGNLAGGALGLSAQAAATPMVAANTAQRELESYVLESNELGNLTVNRDDYAQSPLGNAAISLAQGALTIMAELSGGAAGKLVSKISAKSLTSDVAKVAGWMFGANQAKGKAANAFTQSVNDFRKAARIDGLIPEINEEYIEKFANTMFIPQTAYQRRSLEEVNIGRAQNGLPPITKWTGFFNLDEFLSIATSVGITQGMFGISNIPNYAQVRRVRSEFKKAADGLSDEAKANLDYALNVKDVEERKKAVRNAVNNITDDSELQSAFKYVAYKTEGDFLQSAMQAENEEANELRQRREAVLSDKQELINHAEGIVTTAVDKSNPEVQYNITSPATDDNIVSVYNPMTGEKLLMPFEQLEIKENLSVEQFADQLLAAQEAQAEQQGNAESQAAQPQGVTPQVDEVVSMGGKTYAVSSVETDQAGKTTVQLIDVATGEAMPKQPTVEEFNATFERGESGWVAKGENVQGAESTAQNASQNYENQALQNPERAQFYDKLPLDRNGEVDERALTPEQHIQYAKYEIDDSGALEIAQSQYGALKKKIESLQKQPKTVSNIKALNELKNRQATYGSYITDYQTNSVQAKSQAAEFEKRKAQAQEKKRVEQEQRAAADKENANIITHRWQNSPKVEGRSNIIILPNGERIRGKYILTEAGAYTPSHDVNNNFAKSEGFPTTEQGETVNDRNYERDNAAQQQVLLMAQQYDGRALQEPVVVTPDGIVISGNNRTMSGILAAQNSTDGAYNEYVAELSENYGFTPEQVGQLQHPRVVFQTEEAIPYTSENFAKFNASEKKTQNTVEKAVKVGKTVSDETSQKLVDLLSSYANLENAFSSRKATAEILKLLTNEGVLLETEQEQYVVRDERGALLNQSGQEFVETLLLGKVANEDAIRKLYGLGDVRNSILQAIFPISRNTSLGDYSLKNELSEAILLIDRSREKNKQGARIFGSVDDFLLQVDMFREALHDKTVVMLARALDSKEYTKLIRIFTSYNSIAENAKAGQADIFSGSVLTKEQILTEVLNGIENGNTAASTGSQEADNADTGNMRSGEPQSERRGNAESGASSRNDSGVQQPTVGNEPEIFGQENDRIVSRKENAERLRERYDSIISELSLLPEGEQRNSRYAEVKDELAELEQQITGAEDLEEIKARNARLKKFNDEFDAAYRKNNVSIELGGNIFSLRKDENGDWQGSDSQDSEFSLYRIPNSKDVILFDNKENGNYARVDANGNVEEVSKEQAENIQALSNENEIGNEPAFQAVANTPQEQSIVDRIKREVDGERQSLERQLTAKTNELNAAKKRLGVAYAQDKQTSLFGSPDRVLNALFNVERDLSQENVNSILAPIQGEISSLREKLSGMESVREQRLNRELRDHRAQTSLFQRTNNAEFEAVNARFNDELQQQINGTLPKEHTYKLGNAGNVLQAAGVPNLPIELRASRLSDKSMQENHPFDLSEVRDLPKAIQNPLAVFEYGDRSKAVNIITELEYNGEKLLVGLHIMPKVKGNVVEINSISSIFPKNTQSIIDWINSGKGIYFNKERVLNFLDQQQTNSADVAFGLPDNQAQQENSKLSATNIVQNFQNPTFAGEKFTPISEQDFNALIDRLKKAGLAKEVIAYEGTADERIKGYAERKEFSAGSGVVYGFVTPDGNVYLDRTKMNANTPIHEFGHLWNSFVRENNAELWNRIARLTKATPYYKNLSNNPAYAKLSEQQRVDEAFAQAMGDRGEQLFNSGASASLKDRFAKLLSDFWAWLGEKLGIRQLSPEQISNLTFEQAVNGALADITSGKPIMTEQDVLEQIRLAEAETDINPTEAQKEAGNYKKGHVRIQGFDISIEQPKGSTRRGVDENGRAWETTMKNTYGYFGKTESRDGDHIDVFLGSNPLSKSVFVVDQINPETGKFDEHKVMLGFEASEEAKAAYLSNYEKNWKGLGSITEANVDDFRDWATKEGARVKPFAEYKQNDTNSQELKRIKEAAQANGTFMLAPNGKPTNLNERQWLQVRTEAFKRWFGDWENNPENSSKVVDENEEPMVVYHGTNADFTKFNYSKFRQSGSAHGVGFYFTDSEPIASAYGKSGAYFLNIKKLISNRKFTFTDKQISEILKRIDPTGYGYLSSFGDVSTLGYTGLTKEITQSIKEYTEDDGDFIAEFVNLGVNPKEILNIVRDVTGKDGAIYVGIYKDEEGINRNLYLPYNSNQIKSASDNNGSFDSKNDDIRFQVANEVNREVNTAKKAYEEKKKEVGKKSVEAILGNGNGASEQDMQELRNLEEKTNPANVMGGKVGNEINAEAENLDTKMRELRRLLQDSDIYVKGLQDWTVKNGGKVGEAEDVYNEINRSMGIVTDRVKQFEDNELKKLIEEVKAAMKLVENSDIAKGVENVKINEKGKEKWVEREVNPYIAVSRYLQAKDIVEGEALGLPDRGREGFENTTGRTLEAHIVEAEKLLEEQKDKLWEAVRRVNHFGLDRLYESGKISNEAITEYKRRMFYVPERGWDSRAEENARGLNRGYSEGFMGAQYGSGYNKATVKAKGRQSLADVPLPFMQSIAHSSIAEAEKNKYKQRALNLVRENLELGRKTGMYNLTETWFVNNGLNKVTGEVIWNETTVKPSEADLKKSSELLKEIAGVKRVIPYWSGRKNMSKVNELAKRVEQLERQLPVRRNVAKGFIPHETKSEERQRQVEVYENGIKYILEFSEPKVANAINKSDIANNSIIAGKWWGKGTRYLAAAFTQYNPAFSVVNFARDYTFANLANITEHGFKYTRLFNKNIVTSQAAIMRHVAGKPNLSIEADRKLRQFFEEGAATGYTYLKDIDQLKSNIRKLVNPTQKNIIMDGVTMPIRKMGKLFSAINEGSELACRFATFRTTLEMGGTPRQAAIDAKNATVNFNRKGTLGTSINSLIAFFNAGIQGGAKGLQLVRRNLESMLAIATGLAAMGFLNTMLTMGDDDEDKRWTDYDRWNNVLLGDYKIPLPHFFRAPYAWGVEIALAVNGKRSIGEALFNSVKLATSEILPDAINPMAYLEWSNRTNFFAPIDNAIVRNIAPTLALPIVEIAYLNEDFAGRRIYKEPLRNKENVPYNFWNKRNDSEIAQEVSNFLTWAFGGDKEIKDTRIGVTEKYIMQPLERLQTPGGIEHVVTSYTGGTGKLISDVIKLGYNVFRNFSSGEPIDVANIPVYNRFVKQYNEDRKLEREYYNLLRWASNYEYSINANYKAIVKKDGTINEKARENYERLNRSGRRRIQAHLGEVDKALNKFEEASDIIEARNGNSEALRKQRKELIKQANALQKELQGVLEKEGLR